MAGASDAFKAGASWGDGVADKVSSFFDFGGGGTGGTDLGSGFDLSSIADNTGLTADNTGKTADALAVTEEQLEYLRGHRRKGCNQPFHHRRGQD